MIAENTISVAVGHWVISFGIAQLFELDIKPRSILATHAFNLFGIKISWHSTKGGSVLVGVERVSVINRYPVCP